MPVSQDSRQVGALVCDRLGSAVFADLTAGKAKAWGSAAILVLPVQTGLDFD